MNKEKFLNILSFAVLLLIISGCSATYYKLQSTDKDIDYYKGREVAYRNDDDFSSSVSFEDQDNGNFIFYVTVKNLSKSSITFYPENVYADQLNENKELINDPDKNRSRHKAKRVGDDVATWVDNQTNENVNYDIDKNDINSQKDFWKNQVLRKTSLYQNDNIGGLVFVPFNKDAKYIRLVVPVGYKQYIYLFRKIEIN
jgi:hypothetical protein